MHFLDLPDDVRDKIISQLEQKDHAALLTTCRSLYNAVFPHIFRLFRCACCGKDLFPPCELVAPPHERPRDIFLELRPRLPRHTWSDTIDSAAESDKFDDMSEASDVSEDGDTAELKQLGLTLDPRRGAANFHVLAHLAKTMFASARFPLPEEMFSVRTLRCIECGVFVGFRKNRDIGAPVDFVHIDFIDLCDIRGRPRALKGTVIRSPDNFVRCAGCDAELFERADMLPWAHVLASTRLRDMDAYLEWEHSYGGGGGTPENPAFFVRRLRKGCYRVSNVRVETLRQGDMEIGDATCKNCRKHIGWKFLAEIGGEGQLLQNYDQVGRFGIIRSAITPSDPRIAW